MLATPAIALEYFLLKLAMRFCIEPQFGMLLMPRLTRSTFEYRRRAKKEKRSVTNDLEAILTISRR